MTPHLLLERAREAVERDPNDLSARRDLAAAAEGAGLWTEAARALEAMLPLARDRAELAEIHLRRADLLERRLDDRAAARRHLELALQVLPDRLAPWVRLMVLDLEERRWSRAVAHVDHALELAAADAPERPWLLLGKAIASRRVNTSLSPQSTFMRQLAAGNDPPAAGPAERAWRDAAARLPELAGTSFRAFVEDEVAAVRFVAERARAVRR